MKLAINIVKIYSISICKNKEYLYDIDFMDNIKINIY